MCSSSLANLTIGFSFRWYASQEWLSAKYIDDAEKWGVFDPERWDAFYGWLYENKLTTHDLRTMGYTNDYLS